MQGLRMEVTSGKLNCVTQAILSTLGVSVSPPVQWAVEAGDLAQMSFESWILRWCRAPPHVALWLWRPAAESPAKRAASDSPPRGGAASGFQEPALPTGASTAWAASTSWRTASSG